MLLISGLAFLAAASSFQGEVTSRSDVELLFGRVIFGRRIADGEGPFQPGEKLIAWTQVSGMGSGFIEHVWYRDGKEVARHYLPVGDGRRWRTWSRHQLKTGSYTVDVLGPDGRLLTRGSFTVSPPELGEGC